MAVITVYDIVEVSYKQKNVSDYAINIDVISFVDGSTKPTVFGNAKPIGSVVSDNLPITIEPHAAVSGSRSRSFLDDYYNRIHILPSTIELGNLLSNQTRNVEVWSSYFDSKLLSTVLATGNDGIELSQPHNPPTYFAPLESRIYVLNISTSGPPVIDAVYQFNFTSESPTLGVTGRRVVVVPNKPKYPLKESLEWKTDILKSFNGEQRIRLRDAPRQIFSIESVIDKASYTKLKAISYQWAHRVFAIPMWIDATLVSSIASGSSIIYLDTTSKDFRSNDIVVIWKSDSDYEAIETLDVYADRIELKLPTSKLYTNALVIPTRFANTLSGISFSRDADEIIKLAANFTVRINKNLESIASFQMYKSVPVLLDKPLSSDSLSDSYIRDVDTFDNGSAAVELDIKTSRVDISSKMTFLTFDPIKAFTYRQFLHYLHGRQKTFFVPSWHDEFNIITDFSSASTSITIENIGFTLYYDNRHLYIELNSGQKAYCKILSSTVNNDGDEQLNLESAIGFNATVNDIKICCLLKYVRLNSDTVHITHDVADEFRFDIQVLEVPYEL